MTYINHNCFYVVKLPLTALGCYSTNFRFFPSLSNKLFSYELIILNYDGLWENKNAFTKLSASIG